ncbi:hypothetical protein [Mycolicibacterium rhodesiae]|uniref:hypothetical protein n=1 Tax=Mycolicibacterium rhodesiae TaxID=36814 RepID=UPI00022E6237|nr:hypothetical protein [Mycolicibacterium rhodesiae]
MAIGLAPKTPLDVIEPAAATLVALVGRWAVTLVVLITNSLVHHQRQQRIGCMAYAAPIGLIGVIQMVEPGALTVAQLGLVGPRRPCVHGKVTSALAAPDGRTRGLAVVVFVNPLVSLFKYLRWIIPAFWSPKEIGYADEPAASIRPPAP